LRDHLIVGELKILKQILFNENKRKRE